MRSLLFLIALQATLAQATDLTKPEALSAKLEGAWASLCSQTQINSNLPNGKQGYLIETYIFGKQNSFQLKKEWFKDSKCTESLKKDESESGTIRIGAENLNNGFNPDGTVDADFSVLVKSDETKTDLGLLWMNTDGTKIRISRGMSGGFRNTMLGLFEFSNIKE